MQCKSLEATELRQQCQSCGHVFATSINERRHRARVRKREVSIRAPSTRESRFVNRQSVDMMTMMSGFSVTVQRALRGRQGLSYIQRSLSSSVLRKEAIILQPAACGRVLSSRSFHTHVCQPSVALQAHQNPLAGCRLFNSEAEFHSVADETLDAIQDAMEEFFEEIGGDDLEVNCASGVLTLSLPPHGTWVINKQTPNRQLWWSSPVSGPRRYEYEDGQWVFTRSSEEAPLTLGDALVEEIRELYDVDLELDI